ncbi:MAG: hypothetical protein AAGC56_12475, partial [Pseudomonadota bacterium]
MGRSSKPKARAGFDKKPDGEIRNNIYMKKSDEDEKNKKSAWQKFFEALSTIVMFLFVIIGACIALFLGLSSAFQSGVETGKAQAEITRLAAGTQNRGLAVGMSDASLDVWSGEVNVPFIVEKKTQALQIMMDGSENIFLGKFEHKALTRPREAGLHYYLAAADGNGDAFKLIQALNLSPSDRSQIRNDFVEIHKLSGRDGHLRLGYYNLG